MLYILVWIYNIYSSRIVMLSLVFLECVKISNSKKVERYNNW